MSPYAQTCAQLQALHGSWTRGACQRQTARQMMSGTLLCRRCAHHFSLVLSALLRCNLVQGSLLSCGCRHRQRVQGQPLACVQCSAGTRSQAQGCRHRPPAGSAAKATAVVHSAGENAGAVRGSHCPVCMLCRHKNAGAVRPVCLVATGATAAGHTAGAGPGSHEPMAGSCQWAGASALQSRKWPGSARAHSGAAGIG